MEVQFGPNSVEEPNLLYKLQRKVKVFGTSNNLPNRGYNLIASASKYGIVFIATPDGILSAYYLKQLIDNECEPEHISINLQDKPTHIAVNCDHELLSVTCGPTLYVFNVSSFQNPNPTPNTIKLDVNPGTYVSSLQWNPCIPDTIGIVYFDGTILVVQISNNQVKKIQAKARCLCWSPKGKQLVIGNNDGTLMQYKPDLSPMKTVPAPNIFEGAPVEAVAIHWISTYQFAVVYRNASDNSRPCVNIVNTPKGGTPSCLNYEDVCFSMGSNRPWFYYLQGLAQWNMILSASSNSMEIATLSSDGANWIQWRQGDEGRPELPLTNKKEENYPVGICIDTCAVHQLPWGENEALPFMPLLHVVSQTGLLTSFNIINLNKQAPQFCSPPQTLVMPAGALKTDIPGMQAQPTQPTQAPAQQPKEQVQQNWIKGIPLSQDVQQAQSQMAQTNNYPPKPQPAASSQPLQGGQELPSRSTKNQMFTQAALSQKPSTETKTAQPPAPATVQQPPQQITIPAPTKQPSSEQKEANAALKAEQEKANIQKANQEFKKMLIKEVNDFQNELYKFKVKCFDTQEKLNLKEFNLQSLEKFSTITAEDLRKDCCIEELRASIIQLKLDLVRTCAVVAEARTHSDAKDQMWTQPDPLTAQRIASIKKVAYYIQTQIEQAHKALDYKWNEISYGDNKTGPRMIRPILDDVYQPLVKQQEILGRQQVVLQTLKNALKDIEPPLLQPTGLFRTTPFKNKDPLSKLTKNILNMSLEPNKTEKPKALTSQKLDALRDLLSNHKTVRIKPINVELRQQLAAMKLNYQKSIKEKQLAEEMAKESNKLNEPKEPTFEKQVIAQPIAQVVIQPVTQPIIQPVQQPKIQLVQKPTIQPIQQPTIQPVSQLTIQPVKQPTIQPLQQSIVQPTQPSIQISLKPVSQPTQPMPKPVYQQPTAVSTKQPVPLVASFTPNSKQGLQNVARTLFTDEPQKEPVQVASQQKPQQMPISVPKPPSPFTFGTTTAPPVGDITRSALKDLLQNKSQIRQPKNDANLFLGQKICSPTSFTASTPLPTSQASKPVVKPTSEIAKLLNTNASKPPEVKNNSQPAAAKTNENIDKNKQIGGSIFDIQTKETKPISQIDSKATPLGNITTTSTASAFSFGKIDGITKLEPKSDIDKSALLEKFNDKLKVAVKVEEKKENVPTSVSSLPDSKPSVFGTTSLQSGLPALSLVVSDQQKPIEPKSEISKLETKDTTATSLFSAANAASASDPKSVFGTTVQSVTAIKPQSSDAPKTEAISTSTATTASSATVATTPTSVFTTTTKAQTPNSSAASIFASASQSSGFGQAQSQSSVFGVSDSQSVFGATPTVFSTPAPASPTSVFGTSTSSSAFGTAAPTITTQSASVFGSSSTPASVFGATTSSQSVFSTTQASVFGGSASPSSIFGAAPKAASVFGTSTSTTQPSVFSSPTTQASVFGAPTTGSSVFGTSTASQPTVFGGATTQTSIFGGSATTQASVFGSTTSTTQASVFGTPTPTAQPSVFGTPTQESIFGSPPAATTQSGSLFGGTDNLFAAATISTTSAPSPSSGSIFGGSPSSVFGGTGTTNVFGSKSPIGQNNATAASIFGAAAGSTFGQKPSSSFWGQSTTSPPAFGSSTFGQPSTTQAPSVFGSGSFSAPSTGQPFSSPTNQGSVFGSPQQKQTSPAFGGSPVFGSKPAFGQSAGFGQSGFGQSTFGGGGFNKSPGGFGSSAFGSGATFGGGATFGSTSPGKTFGGAQPASFGTTQSNATFESLATQNTVSFGNLAQQSGQSPQQQPGFNASASFTGWRS